MINWNDIKDNDIFIFIKDTDQNFHIQSKPVLKGTTVRFFNKKNAGKEFDVVFSSCPEQVMRWNAIDAFERLVKEGYITEYPTFKELDDLL